MARAERGGWRLAAIWACFLARLLFYCAMLPLWEGYDEWAHFAVIRHVAAGEALVSRQAAIPRDVQASLGLAPVPWEMRSLGPPALTEDAYWRLPADARAERQQALRAMPRSWQREDGAGGFTAYEALQPPLYYWIMALVLRVCRGAGLAVQVLVLRWVSALIASAVVPLVFLVAREALEEDWPAYGCAAIVAVMPGLAVDVARVGNDGIAIVLFSLLTWLAVRMVKRGMDRTLALCMGVTLGLGLLAKAYFLTAIPAIFLLWLVSLRRKPGVLNGLLLGAVSVTIAGWWYARNLLTTGTLSGLSEAVTLRNVPPAAMVKQAAAIPWPKAIDAILFSHLYFGGWSSLTVRSWMYHVFYGAILLAAVGVVWQFRKRETLALVWLNAAFWLGQLYNVVLLFMSKGLPGSMGWYLYAVVAAEVVLSVAGLRRILPGRARGWAPSLGVALFALLDLYTVHALAIPYYTGMIRHKANGALAAVHLADFRAVGAGETFARMAAFKEAIVPPPVTIGLWAVYLCATVWVLREWIGGAKSQG